VYNISQTAINTAANPYCGQSQAFLQLTNINKLQMDSFVHDKEVFFLESEYGKSFESLHCIFLKRYHFLKYGGK
jgi:hypothetical protein